MVILLTIMSGPAAGRRVELSVPGRIRVGRAGADFATSDPYMSKLHFELEYDGCSSRLHDLGSRNGTEVNGQRVVAPVLLHDGDMIRCGESDFVVSLVQVRRAGAVWEPARSQNAVPWSLPESSVPAAPVSMSRPEPARPKFSTYVPPKEPIELALPPRRPSEPRDLRELLREQPGTLYVLLDAARAPKIPELLGTSGERYQSLYDGEKGEDLAPYGPYLVVLPPDSPLLDTLLAEGWGNSWGVYLTSDLPFDEVRRHLRHFLMVQRPDGRQLYFRFYDPRVLRAALPLFKVDEAFRFFGQITCYLMEGETPDRSIRFNLANNGCVQAEFPLIPAESH